MTRERAKRPMLGIRHLLVAALMPLAVATLSACETSEGLVVEPPREDPDCCYLTLAWLSAEVLGPRDGVVAKASVEPITASPRCPPGKPKPAAHVGRLPFGGLTDKWGRVELNLWLDSNAPTGSYCVAFAVTDSARARADTVVLAGIPFLRSRVMEGGAPALPGPYPIVLRTDL